MRKGAEDGVGYVEAGPWTDAKVAWLPPLLDAVAVAELTDLFDFLVNSEVHKPIASAARQMTSTKASSFYERGPYSARDTLTFHIRRFFRFSSSSFLFRDNRAAAPFFSPSCALLHGRPTPHSRVAGLLRAYRSVPGYPACTLGVWVE